MDFKKEELVKSPLNYTGGKFKLLPQFDKHSLISFTNLTSHAVINAIIV